MTMTIYRSMATAILAVFALSGCSGGGGGGGTVSNPAPVIQSLQLTGAPASPGGAITATVDVQSALSLTYSWSVSNGWSISSGGTSSIATLIAPHSYTATGAATVTVTDSQNRSVIGSIDLSTVNDIAPVISKITITPQPVMTSTNLVATASDQYGDPLTYSWTVGGISNILSGSTVTWKSPGIPGYYTVSVAVSDGTTTVNGSVSKMSIGSESPWPRFGRDIQGTRSSPIDTSATGTATKWTYTTGAAIGFSSPAIGADGTVYVGSTDGYLYALNFVGAPTWSFQLGGALSSPAIGADGTVYVGSSISGLYAFSSDGTPAWNFPTSAVNSSPAIGADGTVYVGSGKLYAVNPNGSLKWVSTEGVIHYSSPAIGSDGTVYVGSDGGYLYAFNPDSTVKWKYSIGGAVSYSSPAIGADGTVYIGSTGGSIYAFNPGGGPPKWSYAPGSFFYCSPAIGVDGTVYVGAFNGNIYALDPTNGTPKWSHTTTTGIPVESSPAIGADGTVYIGSSDNNLYAINPTNGTVKWSYATGGAVTSSPSIGADGTVYVGSGDKKVYAVK